ncbi:MAG: aminomethyl-transferring glycine dehydrogenase subunit GcvPB [Nitrospinota bacterium]
MPTGDGYQPVGARGLVFEEPLLFEKSAEGRRAYSLPALDVPARSLEELLPPPLCRADIEGFPELSELDVVRHYTRLSQWNYGIDQGFYPLGSCTMKYNPKVNEEAARLPGFARAHPMQPEGLSQGALRLLWELEQFLKEITGMDRVILQPAAGAQGELTGMLLIRARLADRGNPRKKVMLPDSAHGTNPASSALCGYRVVEVESGPRGILEPAAVEAAMDDEVAAIMLTNPNTLGLFEENVLEVSRIVHGRGGFVYCDGANMNALMGVGDMARMGVDVLQLNLHKTFSTPHGGGGPGAGPVAIREELAPYRPVPLVEREGERFRLQWDLPKSIGKVRSFTSSFGVMVRAHAYIRTLGADGLARASQLAVLNANYLRARLRDLFHVAYDRPCMHEVIFSDRNQLPHGVSTLDIAKRLMDYGYHPPTIYFPLLVKGALMVEPTETESPETLDEFVEAMRAIAREAEEQPELLKSAPHLPKLGRLDESRAAKQPVLRWRPGSPGGGTETSPDARRR